MITQNYPVRVLITSCPTDHFIHMDLEEAQFLIEQGEILLLGFDGPGNPTFIVDAKNGECTLSDEKGEDIVVQNYDLQSCLQMLWDDIGERADDLYYGGP